MRLQDRTRRRFPIGPAAGGQSGSSTAGNCQNVNSDMPGRQGRHINLLPTYAGAPCPIIIAIIMAMEMIIEPAVRDPEIFIINAALAVAAFLFRFWLLPELINESATELVA